MLVIEPEGEQYAVLHNARETCKQLHVVSSLEMATGLAEDYARKVGATKLTSRSAPWRRKPPTDGQLTAMRKLGIRERAETSGEASDLISVAIAQIEARRGARAPAA